MRAAVLILALAACSSAGASFPVTVTVDAAKEGAPFRPISGFFGADEPNYATAKEGRALLAEMGALGEPVYFRAHNLLTSGDGTPSLKWGSTNAYTEGANGEPIYSWTLLDGIFDSYREFGIRPYVEMGFMPEAMSVAPEPYRHQWSLEGGHHELFTGWAYPPKDYAKWGELIRRWVEHCVARYGAREVRRWYWETWNEPNIGYWKGSPEEFLKLHDFAVAGVRRALPDARVGGPDVAGDGGAFMRRFIEHCLRDANYATGETGTPLDFVSFHAKGAPVVADGHVRMGLTEQLRTVDTGFRLIASYPELGAIPVVIGENDPDSCAACRGAKYGYRTTTQYASYTAECLAREIELADLTGVNLQGALTWAFEFEDQPYFAGFRTLATRGIDLPIFGLFRMLSTMHGRRVASSSSAAQGLAEVLASGIRGQPDVSALACADDSGRLYILLWHYHDDDVAGPEASVHLQLAHLPSEADRGVRVSRRWIDRDHGDAFTVWQRMGSPSNPTAEQAGELVAAGRAFGFVAEPLRRPNEGGLDVAFSLPRQAVALVVVDWAPDARSPGDPSAGSEARSR